MTAAPADLLIDRPATADGAALWRLAKDSKTLDVNSSYSYLLWCRDFAGTSAVARGADGTPVGFVTGYIRPDRPRTLLVWQVAVDSAHRGHGIAAALLDGLTARLAAERGVTDVETTITPGNTASERLFTSFAERHGAPLVREVLFPAELFPDGPHDPEVLYRIGPLTETPAH
ncbi:MULTISPECIES: diaminobutyrate acetyltransferase [Streptomyces]|uniref:L-2,4-diaminobutyric acid acetyltransferase n=1 Tax=Streptomyces misionensis TaxID=67331 RepID=A0A1H4TJ96_9ACTN|nr:MULTISPECIES: diaminobutyrate acetyltransferase [Streptomyces]SEC56429.1 diaminobutyrate acetyltransferase [Streptomyces misionensis]SFY52504.1 L-2,4-diaminobutyric acid acetyltransferase [Streptomyces sp. F-1]